MGIIVKKGAIGTVNGKVGDVVVTTHRGKLVVKDTPRLRSKRDKKPKSAQNFKISLISRFLSFFTEDVRIGFYRRAAKIAPFQRAVSYNIRHAVTGAFPDFSIDYSKIVFSEGAREIAWSGKVTAEGKGFRISWEVPPSSKLKVIGKDKGHLMVYNHTKDRPVEFREISFERADLSYATTIPLSFFGDDLHVWLFFSSPDGKTVSNSQYLGTVNVPAQ